MSSARPFICMAPSPAKMMAGRSGWPNLAPMPYGTPGPIVARVPDSEPRTSPRNFSCRAYQLADEPESAATMALAGSRVDSSRNSSIGLMGLASTSASASMDRHQRSTPASTPSRQERLGHPGAEQLGDLLEFAPCAPGALPGQDRDLAPGVQDLGRPEDGLVLRCGDRPVGTER